MRDEEHIEALLGIIHGLVHALKINTLATKIVMGPREGIRRKEMTLKDYIELVEDTVLGQRAIVSCAPRPH